AAAAVRQPGRSPSTRIARAAGVTGWRKTSAATRDACVRASAQEFRPYGITVQNTMIAPRLHHAVGETPRGENRTRAGIAASAIGPAPHRKTADVKASGRYRARIGRDRTREGEYENPFARMRRSPRKNRLLPPNRSAFKRTRAPAPARRTPAIARGPVRSRPIRTAVASVNTGIAEMRIDVLIAVVNERPRMKRSWLNETPSSASRKMRARSEAAS